MCLPLLRHKLIINAFFYRTQFIKHKNSTATWQSSLYVCRSLAANARRIRALLIIIGYGNPKWRWGETERRYEWTNLFQPFGYPRSVSMFPIVLKWPTNALQWNTITAECKKVTHFCILHSMIYPIETDTNIIEIKFIYSRKSLGDIFGPRTKAALARHNWYGHSKCLNVKIWMQMRLDILSNTKNEFIIYGLWARSNTGRAIDSGPRLLEQRSNSLRRPSVWYDDWSGFITRHDFYGVFIEEIGFRETDFLRGIFHLFDFGVERGGGLTVKLGGGNGLQKERRGKCDIFPSYDNEMILSNVKINDFMKWIITFITMK